MKALATYVMRGRLQSIAISSLFAMLSLIIPPLSYISGAVVALVTLRRGISEGVVIVIAATMALAVISQITMGNVLMAVVYAIMVWLPVWVLAIVLRRSISLPITLSVAALICGLAVLGFHGAVGDTVLWWQGILDKILGESLQQPGLDVAEMQLVREKAPQFMTGLMASTFFISMILSLFLARFWQAALYNPGGFKSEFQSFRVDKVIAILGAILMIWALLAQVPGTLASDLSIVISVYASIAGIALVHHWIVATNSNKSWLILMYLLLVFFTPQILVLLAIIGFADAWMNIRRFYTNRTI